MKRILIFIDWYLPGYKAGGPVQSVANLVNFLKSMYYIDIVTTNTDYTDDTPYYQVKSNNWNQSDENVRVFYFDKKYLSFRRIAHFINPDIYDIVYINGIYSRYFSILPLFLARLKKISRIIVAPRGMFSSQSLKVKKKRKYVYIKLLKLIKWYKHVIVQVTNDYEKDIVKELYPECEVFVASNFPRICSKESYSIVKLKNELRLVFLGRISPEKNLLFALQVLKEISHINIKFDVYGALHDKKYWKDCKEVYEKLPGNIEFSYKGNLKSDLVHETLMKYHALFLPSIGENFGHSIFETLSVGRPVIISKNTPWRDLLSNNAGWDISLKNDEEFISAINKLGDMEQTEFEQWSRKAKSMAESFLSDSGIKLNTLKLFAYEQDSKPA